MLFVGRRFLVFLSKWDSELWLTGYLFFEIFDFKEEAFGSSAAPLEEEDTPTMREDMEGGIPVDGECITLSYFIQVHAFINN